MKWYLYSMGVVTVAFDIGIAVKFRHHPVGMAVFLAAGAVAAFGIGRAAYRYGRRKPDGQL